MCDNDLAPKETLYQRAIEPIDERQAAKNKKELKAQKSEQLNGKG